jgi:MFS family permease
VQAEFGVARGAASLPYTLTMLGFAIGGVFMGRLADRVGIVPPLLIGGLALGIGYVAASRATSLLEFALAQGLIIGLLGSSAMLGPLIADISLWFRRRRGIAVGIVASGNYLSGTVWPPIVQYGIETVGWRQTHIYIGLFASVAVILLAMTLRRRAPADSGATATTVAGGAAALGVSPGTLQALLVFAGLACCVAMSMPQVHIVAYCGDLGYGPARGAEMLSLMLGFGALSRMVSGWISDRIGGVRTLMLGSFLQCLALLLYLPFDGLISLYIVSILFGLSQGGIVPSYAIIVRELFPAKEAGARVGIVLMATIVGMALGGWLTGVIFDLTGSYQAAFLHGIAWNLINMAIAAWLLIASGQMRRRVRTTGQQPA